MLLYCFPKGSARVKADKKIYFANPFVFYSLVSLLTGEEGFYASRRIISKNRDILVEGIVASHLIATKEVPYLQEWKTYLWTYYTKTGKEIDFIYRGDGYLGIEVEYKEEIDIREITRIHEINKNIVLTKNQFEIYEDLIFIPVPVFLIGLDRSERTL